MAGECHLSRFERDFKAAGEAPRGAVPSDQRDAIACYLSAGEGWTEAQWRTAEAADFTVQVADVLHARIIEQGLDSIYTSIELPLAPLLQRIERAGLRVDTSVLGELSALFGSELEKLTKRIYEVAGREFKINSPKQVGEISRS